MEHELVVVDDAASLAASAARFVAARMEEASGESGCFRFAVSGGSTPWAMFGQLVALSPEWESVELYQVDERIAPEGDPDRNLTHLRDALGGSPAKVIPMPVDDPHPASAAEEYADLLPPRFDLLHLGLGPDGHTASLVPGDPVLEVSDALVGVTGTYQGHRRMTLTYPGIARAAQLVWLVSGEDKRDALRRLLDGDASIPAGRVEAGASTVFADRAAAR